MKMRSILAGLAAVTISANAASVTYGSADQTGFAGPPTGTPSGWFDNAGNPTLTNIYLFTGSSPTDFATALALVEGSSSIDAQALPALGGLVAGGFAPAVPVASPIIGQPLFMILANADNSNLAAYQMATVITNADTPVPFSGDELIEVIGSVTLGTATVGAVDQTAFGLGNTQVGFNVLAAAIPEPSSALLLGLGGLGLLIRRKR